MSSYEEFDVDACKRSIRTQKGHLSRRIKAAEKAIAAAGTPPEKAAVKDLENEKRKIEETFSQIEQLYTELLDYSTIEADTVAYGEALTFESDRKDDILTLINTKIYAATTQERPQAHQSRHTNTQHQDKAKAINDLKPFILTKDHSPAEMELWLADFGQYYSASRFQLCPIAEQRGYFLKCIDDNLRKIIEPQADDSTPVYGEGDSITFISILQEEFSNQYPLLVRRLEYFQLQHTPGTSFSETCTKLKQLASMASMADLQLKDLHMFRYLTMCQDRKLKEKLMEIEEPTLEKMDKYIRSYEAKLHSMEKMGDSTGRSDARAVNTSKAGAAIFEMKKKGQCTRCGLTNHTPDKCNFKTAKCKKCGKQGHIARVCQSKQEQHKRKDDKRSKGHATTKARATRYRSPSQSDHSEPESNTESSEEDEGAKTRYTIARATKSKPTPRIQVTVCPMRGGRPFRFNAVPDTGSTLTIISLDIAKKHNMAINEAGRERLFAVNHERMACEGSTLLKLAYMGQETQCEAIVSSAMREEILISWQELIHLGIIPKQFPAIIRMTHNKKPDDLDQIKLDFEDVLSDTLDDTPIKGPPMEIHMKGKEIKPTRILTARKIPIHWEKAAKKAIQTAIKNGKLRKVEEPTDWISPGFFVPKGDPDKRKQLRNKNKEETVDEDDLRLVVDFTGLNKAVLRPVHPFPSSQNIIDSIPQGSHWFATLDACQGYHQVALSEESQLKTTFLLPWGRFCYRVAPMGLCSSSDEFCRRTDDALKDIDFIQKIVDDIIVFAPTKTELLKRVRIVLEKCRDAQITISKRKFKIGQRVKFAGHIISNEGCQPDPSKLKAISEFPAPTNVSEMRAFLGLANQLGSFVPDLAHTTEPLRQLLKRNVSYNWLEDHQSAFDETKKILTSNPVVKHFDPGRPTTVVADASRLKGIGWALLQEGNDKNKYLVRAGSRSLSDTESRYATIELETLAIKEAVTKCRHFLLGMPGFTVLTDHKPLVNIFTKPMDDLTNPRIVRMREKIAPFVFEVNWVPGKSQLIADSLSRAPRFSPNGTEEDPEENTVNAYHTTADPLLQPLCQAAKEDKEYQELLETIRSDKGWKTLPADHLGKTYSQVWNRLSTEGPLVIHDGKRIVVPNSYVTELLKRLHESHAGISKTKLAAQQLYYWNGMSNDIKKLVEDCRACQEIRPSQPQEPLIWTEAKYPMEQVGIDLFECQGNHYMVMIDRKSGFPFAKKLSALTTKAITSILDKWFMDFGYPKIARTDGGPQFRTEFKKFCKEKNIVHEQSSPYYAQSNGLAENAVKSIKHLVTKNPKALHHALMEWRNTPRSDDGHSPAQWMFGRRQRSILPALPTVFEAGFDEGDAEAKRERSKNRIKKRYDERSAAIPEPNIGSQVMIQNPKSKKWNVQGTIVAKSASGRSYDIATEGEIMRRNRRFIKILAM